MKKNRGGDSKAKGFLHLAIVIIVIAFFGYVAMFGLGKDGSGSIRDIKLGLDLAGGVSITYQATEDNPSETDMKDSVRKLQLRAEGYSTEAEVYQEGSNRINVDIPDVSDANAVLEELGQPGTLSFQDEDGNEILSGDDVSSATGGIIQEQNNGPSEYVVDLTFTDEGSKKFGDATTEMVGKIIYIIYDGEVVSSPVVKEPITGGKCQIDGMESYEEADRVASTIRIGSLPLGLEEVRSNVVGAKLGQQSIETSLMAGAIGFALVLLFMLVVYGLLGLAADIALSMYLGLTIFLLSAFQVTLTLPGIAGIILSIGMAVDANVIIFARIKEELLEGKSMKTAIDDGFKKALSAIIDGNVTTLIAAFVLYVKGSGTVRGFALTLGLGIVVSLFTALLVTRFLVKALYMLGAQNPRLYRMKEEDKDKEKKIIPFMKHSKIYLAFSGLVILLGIGFMVYNGTADKGIFNFSLEFQGGTSSTVEFKEAMTLDEVQEKVVPLVSEVTGDNDIQTQQVADSTQIIIKTRTLSLDEREQMSDKLVEAFGIEADDIQAESISATVSNEMRTDAIIAVVIAAIIMLIYIWIRFSNLFTATSVVFALVHDVLFVIAFYAVLRWTVGTTFIACMLTIVGYSINNSIVIFDRVRENRRLRSRGETDVDVINKSVTQTLGRSINTSITTAIMVLVLLILGVASIRDFAMPLLVGIICGTYSSICLAGTFWLLLSKAFGKKEKAKTKAKAK